MIIDCVSDLHGCYPKLEGGDLLIVAGDLTRGDTEREYLEFFSWLRDQKYEEIVIIAGNHDNYLQNYKFTTALEDCGEFTYLCDSGTEFSYHIDGFPEEDKGFLPSGKRTLKIWGSPWTKKFKGMNPACMAFTVDTEEELAEKWKLIPDDVDILITHCPPHYMQDHVLPTLEERRENFIPACYGSPSLGIRISQIDDLGDGKDRYNICGHIHEGYGMSTVSNLMHYKRTWRVINASYVNEHYEPVNKSIRIEL